MVTEYTSGGPTGRQMVIITRWIAMLVTIAIIGASGAGGIADEPKGKAADVVQTSRLKLKPDRVIVFKDGYCLVVKSGVATTDADGNVFTDEVPDAAVLGSFWAVPEHGTIKATIAGWVNTESTSKREVNCTNIIEIVKSNLSKQCSFVIGEQRVEGTLVKILSNDDPPNLTPGVPQDAHRSELFLTAAAVVSGPQSPTMTFSSVTGASFLVRTTIGDKMISAGSVSDLTIQDMNSTLEQTVTTKTRHKRLTMKFAEANTDIKLNLMYFRPDVRWIPTYRVNLTGQPMPDGKNAAAETIERKKAELIMQGEILNEAEDFFNVPFHVVVGVPNFRFRTLPSPMVLEGTMRNVLSQAAPDIMGMSNNVFSNGVYSQRVSEFRSNLAAGDGARSDVNLPDELVGKGGNDLYVYELPPMNLIRGERALVPILSTEVAYRDIYTWDIELTHSESYAATSAESPSPLILSESKVWRQIELINNTDMPWTTGAAMLVDGKQPLAQELLTYTSPGGICRVPVTVSVDLRGKAEDTEVNRVFGAFKWRGYDYARIEGKIEAELANNKTEPVPVEVSLRFGGKATKVTDDGKITLEAFRTTDWHESRGNPINNSSFVRWTAQVAPGKCFKPVVNYEFLLQQ